MITFVLCIVLLIVGFMTYGKAYGLCEWFEVEQFQNP